MTEEDRKKIENMRSDEDWYRCVECRELAFASSETKGRFKLTVNSRKGRCLDCIMKERSRKASEAHKRTVKKNSTHTIICKICKKPFEGKSAETCSPPCRRKYTEHKKFYKGLAEANVEVRSAGIHVYGTADYVMSTTNKKVTEHVKIAKEEIEDEEIDYDDDSTK